jgi:hypothetical protein
VGAIGRAASPFSLYTTLAAARMIYGSPPDCNREITAGWDATRSCFAVLATDQMADILWALPKADPVISR